VTEGQGGRARTAGCEHRRNFSAPASGLVQGKRVAVAAVREKDRRAASGGQKGTRREKSERGGEEGSRGGSGKRGRNETRGKRNIVGQRR